MNFKLVIFAVALIVALSAVAVVLPAEKADADDGFEYAAQYPAYNEGELTYYINNANTTKRVIVLQNDISLTSRLPITLSYGDTTNPDTALSIGNHKIKITSSPGNAFSLSVDTGALPDTVRVIHIGVSGELTLSNVTITGGHPAREASQPESGNLDDCGGGIFNTGKLFLYSGAKITGNTANWAGGGVYNDAYSEFYMYEGSEVSDNHVTSVTGAADSGGGGVYFGRLWYSSSGTIYGGKITNNTAAQIGGGVSLFYNTVLTVNGGEISNNTAPGGGGIWAHGTVILNSGGKITGNHATANISGLGGGGIIVTEGTVIVKDGAEISNNTASMSGGGGICVDTYGGSVTVE
ncbi:MAG: hypothetical protein LBV63_00590, partial [Candidatus Methanoplasma sp.]|nr:hypothetical protein [Candidatus Methanoplasma sp.]